MAALPLYPLAEEREPGSGDADLVAVQLQVAIRSCRKAGNYLIHRRRDGFDATFRRKVVIWMIKTMAAAFSASAEVSHLAVAFFDRFVAVRSLGTLMEDRVHHLTLACMHLAITFADTPEALATFEHAFGGVEDRKSLHETQRELIEQLGWRLHITTVFNVFELIRALDVDASALPEDAVYVARILIDLALSEAVFLSFSPAEVAIAAAAVGLRERGLQFGGVFQMLRHYGVNCAISHDAHDLMTQLLQRATEAQAPSPPAAGTVTPQRLESAQSDMSRSGSVISRMSQATVGAVPEPSTPTLSVDGPQSLSVVPRSAVAVAAASALSTTVEAPPQAYAAAAASKAASLHPQHASPPPGMHELENTAGDGDDDDDDDVDDEEDDFAGSYYASGWTHAPMASTAAVAELGLDDQPAPCMHTVGEASAWAASLALGPHHEFAGALSAHMAGAAVPAPLTASLHMPLGGQANAFGGATLSMASHSGGSTFASSSSSSSSSSSASAASFHSAPTPNAGVGPATGCNPGPSLVWQA